MRILITGASGFVGSFVVEEGLRQGFEVWAGLRIGSSRQYLQDERIRIAELDLLNLDLLRLQLRRLRTEMGGHGWDYVVHAAGATKARSRDDFFRSNTDGTRNLVIALQEESMMPKRLVFISSLSVLPPGCDKPNTAYGESKLCAEQAIKELACFPFVILRPTGVYGPRERDYYLMAKSIKQHVDFAVGFKKQQITFIYVEDLVQAIYKSLTAEGVEGNTYHLTDGDVYTSRTFSDLLQKEMGDPWVLHIKTPLWLLWVVCAVAGTVCGWMGKTTTLNLDKYHILAQRDWTCDITSARHDLGYEPKWTLERGVKTAVEWYRTHDWL